MAVALSSYQDALVRLLALQSRGMKLGLERIEALVAALGDPHAGLAGVLVAGTNGKGSVSALLESMARAAGLRTVLLTKPHLVSWRERIAVDGIPVSQEVFATLLDDVLAAAASLPPRLREVTVFEALTAMGILAARREQPDVVICEVGLGGRLDSTNVLDLGVAVITTVALDHREQLGDTVEAIAREKAAIIKPGNHVVTAAGTPAREVIERAAARAGAAAFSDARSRLADIDDRGLDGVAARVDGTPVATPLLGVHQAVNLATAVCAARALGERGLPIDDGAIVAGAGKVVWPGRLQWVEGTPPLLVDGAHNTAAMRALVAALGRVAGGRYVVGVIGIMADKDVDDMLDVLRSAAIRPVFTAVDLPRAMPAAELASRYGGGALVAPTVASALESARKLAGAGGLVVAAGSLYVAGEALAAAAAAGAATGLRAVD
ncbi:MAG: bifunctional folylpolyglutamate synthase/dihydrofolate synthase [Candidatus Dormibacteria bacterium]